ncbi:MAG: phosphonate metabolism protein PhnM [Cyanobacteria bacterium P01_E01_bin.48]
MANEQVYTNFRLQLPDREVLGTLVVRDGGIADIQPGIVDTGINGEGEYLLPGLIELHTDNLERCMSPRPGVNWPIEAAAVYHDRDLGSSGVTTVCDAIAIGDTTPGSIRMTHFGQMVDVIHDGQISGRFSVDHRVHLRCELGFGRVAEVVEDYADRPLLSLISLMDHTPGQRQFVNIEKFKEYYMGKRGISAEQMEVFIQERKSEQQRHARTNRRRLAKMARSRQLSVASHDDATEEHVQEAIEDGAAIAEFPTTLEAAKASHADGLKVLMGAPNLVLGGSHSGNISAMDLVELDLVDIISSDYVPRSLLQSIFMIAWRTGRPIYETMRLVTSNPAQAIHLYGDRGSLEVGKRADLIAVRDDGVVPQLTAVVCRGRRVA